MARKNTRLSRQADLVDGIAYSSGLGGRIESCLSVLDSEQQGLSGDALKHVLSLIIWPAQPLNSLMYMLLTYVL